MKQTMKEKLYELLRELEEAIIEASKPPITMEEAQAKTMYPENEGHCREIIREEYQERLNEVSNIEEDIMELLGL